MMSANIHSVNQLSKEFEKHSVIKISKPMFTIGRSLSNCEVIACVAISRLHCTFNYSYDKENNELPCWKISDTSRYGILVNGNKLKKDEPYTLKENDLIQLDLAGEFVYKFSLHNETKKRKYDEAFNQEVDIRIQEAKDKFDNTQTIELDNMKNKISIARQKQNIILNEKLMLQNDLQVKFLNLERDYENKILELRGKHDEVEKQKELLKQQNEMDRSLLEIEMSKKIALLEEKINEQKVYENTLEAENKILLQRLEKEREEFERRLHDIVNVKDKKLEDMDVQLKQKEEELIQEKLRMESLRLQEIKKYENAKDEELRKLQDKMQAEQEAKLQEIESLKLQIQMQEHMSNENKKLNEMEFQQQIDKLKKEAEAIRIRMMEENALRIAEQTEQESVRNAAVEEFNQEKKSLEQKLLHMEEEKQKLQLLLFQKSKQSEEEIQKIQKEQIDKEMAVREQFEKEKQQLLSLLSKESESCNSTVKQMQYELQEAKTKPHYSNDSKPTEVIDLTGFDIPSTSSFVSQADKVENNKCEINRIMDSELQCSVCSDLFIEPVTLNCTHTFCKYCIDTWKKKKNECPVCRCKIKTQFRTIILESLITTMVETLGDEAKEKRMQTVKERQDILCNRNGSEENTRCRQTNGEDATNDSNSSSGNSDDSSTSSHSSDESSNQNDSSDSDEDHPSYGFRRRNYREHSESRDSFGSFYDAHDTYEASWTDCSYNSSNEEGEGEDTSGSRLPMIEGLEGFYYGGYGRCFKCRHPGHWAPGCPFL